MIRLPANCVFLELSTGTRSQVSSMKLLCFAGKVFCILEERFDLFYLCFQ